MTVRTLHTSWLNFQGQNKTGTLRVQAGHAVLLSSPSAQRQIMVEFHKPLDWLGVDRHASGHPAVHHLLVRLSTLSIWKIQEPVVITCQYRTANVHEIT